MNLMDSALTQFNTALEVRQILYLFQYMNLNYLICTLKDVTNLSTSINKNTCKQTLICLLEFT